MVSLDGAHAVHGVERGLQRRDAIVALPCRFPGSTPSATPGSVPFGDLDAESPRPLQVGDVQLGLALGQEAVDVVHGENRREGPQLLVFDWRLLSRCRLEKA